MVRVAPSLLDYPKFALLDPYKTDIWSKVLLVWCCCTSSSTSTVLVCIWSSLRCLNCRSSFPRIVAGCLRSDTKFIASFNGTKPSQRQIDNDVLLWCTRTVVEEHRGINVFLYGRGGYGGLRSQTTICFLVYEYSRKRKKFKTWFVITTMSSLIFLVKKYALVVVYERLILGCSSLSKTWFVFQRDSPQTSFSMKRRSFKVPSISKEYGWYRSGCL